MRSFASNLAKCVWLLGLSSVVVLSGCRTAIDDMAGSYSRSELVIMTATLELTKSGMVVRGGAGISESIGIGGVPVVNMGIQLGSLQPGATQFESLSCDKDTCRFRSKNCPAGSITRDPSGDIVVLADGACASWSGRWSRTGLVSSTAAPRTIDSQAPSPQVRPTATVFATGTVPTSSFSAPVAPPAAPQPRISTCSEPTDCPNVNCECEDGSSVQTRSCINGLCSAYEVACTSSCAKHEGVRGSWDGSVGKKLGQLCRRDGDCNSEYCVRGYCTKECASFSDCPTFWKCEPTGRRSGKFCER